MSGFTGVLAALFLVAQLAGIVSSSRAKAQSVPQAVAAYVHQHVAHSHDDDGKAQEQRQHNGTVDDCCALHAFFAGILPPAIEIETAAMDGTRLAAEVADHNLGLPPKSPDRPPRPLC